MGLHLLICSLLFNGIVAHLPPGYPTDCRNLTWNLHGERGPLHVMSWHIHYNTNVSEFGRFYNKFIDRYRSRLPPGGVKCPFGFDTGESSFGHICSLDDAPGIASEIGVASNSAWYGPFETPSRAFWVPFEDGEEVFKWASSPTVKGTLDVLIHPNTGCMYDDHGPRAKWVTYNGRRAPGIKRLDFPCNVPGYGCSDQDHPCNCIHTPLPSDAPQDSCLGCHPESLPINTLLM